MFQNFQVLIFDEGKHFASTIQKFQKIGCKLCIMDSAKDITDLKDKIFSFQLLIYSDSLAQNAEGFLQYIKKNRKFNTPLLLYLSRETAKNKLLTTTYSYDFKIQEESPEKQLKDLLVKFHAAHLILQKNSLKHMHSNIIDERYFHFYFRMQFRMGWNNLLANLNSLRIQIVDMMRISSIYQLEPETEIFFREYCENLIAFCRRCGAHKLRKAIRINLNLMEKGEYRKLDSFQLHFRKSLAETNAELNKIISKVRPLLIE